MAKVKIGEKEYGLRFDLYSMEQIEEEFGGVQTVFNTLKEGKHQIKTTRMLFRILANSYLSYNGQEETVTGDEIKHAGMDMIRNTNKTSRDSQKAALLVCRIFLFCCFPIGDYSL